MINRLRHVEILERLKNEPLARVKDLASTLEVSEATIRRDLDELEAQGIVRRMHGGVILEGQNSSEISFEQRETLYAEEKKRIAKAAASLIQDNEVVFIDGGTTTPFIIPHLAGTSGVTIITCGLNIAHSLCSYDNIATIVVGGELHNGSQSITGLLADKLFDLYNIRCDRAFITCSGISSAHGVTNRILDRIPLKRKAIAASREKVVLGDSSKVGVTTMGLIAPLTEFQYVVTGGTAPEKELELIKNMGINVLIS